MPSIQGPKAHAISNILRDIPEENAVGFSQSYESSAFGGTPTRGVSQANEISESELG